MINNKIVEINKILQITTEEILCIFHRYKTKKILFEAQVLMKFQELKNSNN